MKKLIIYSTGLMLAVTLVSGAYAVDGGDVNDPLVTQSYVDSKIDEVKAYFEERIDSAQSGTSNGQAVTASTFEVVSLKNGQKLIGGDGTEIILRAGYANVIGSDQGGIADTTSGTDIQNGKDISRNHLLIIPRDDGRGLKANAPNNTIVMVKGTYSIQ